MQKIQNAVPLLTCCVRYGKHALSKTVTTLTLHCAKCGEHEVVYSQVERLNQAIAHTLSTKEKKLLPSEVRFLRKHIGWSPTDFAAKLGVDAATVSRWESKKTPQQMNATAERFLRWLALSETTDAYPLEMMATKAPSKKRLWFDRVGKKWAQAAG